MAISSKFSIKSTTKSISLPSRSHPTTHRIEQLLNAAKTDSTASKPTAETICNGLCQLIELYECVNELVNSSSTRTLISSQQNTKWVDELVDESIRFLDICGCIRDIVTQMKDHVRDLQCVLRRRKCDFNCENGVLKYNLFRKKMKKDVKGFVANLKQVDNLTVNGSIEVDSDNYHLVAVIKSLIGVSEITVLVFESLLMFFGVPNTKPNKWSLVVSKLMHKGSVGCEDQQEQGIGNELESIDVGLQSLCKYESAIQIEKIEFVKCRLEKLEAWLLGFENRLECLFRGLVRNRASLLNIISQ